jgi:hypothetical protein
MSSPALPDVRPAPSAGCFVSRLYISSESQITLRHRAFRTVAVVPSSVLLNRAVALGGVVALPKMAVPGFGWLAYCKDSESNVFGMMQLDPSAA